ncbi:MAG TPA: SRPBCC family protein [Solirubrobacteraceae bacterium]|jgi:uncharacterized protein YndB with AHSA1/START domain|nr:SRPBCC family protein [Solirubrobacteraceae bacterium]
MIELPCEAEIHGSAETIFDLIVDFGGQERWLGKSSAFRGTHEISSDPVVLGTTYREPGPLGVRNGTVTEYERPTRVAFHQPMAGRFHTGTIDVAMRYALSPGAESTHLRRVVTIEIPRSLRLFQPLLVRAFAHESRRTLLALKAYADTLA